MLYRLSSAATAKQASKGACSRTLRAVRSLWRAHRRCDRAVPAVKLFDPMTKVERERRFSLPRFWNKSWPLARSPRRSLQPFTTRRFARYSLAWPTTCSPALRSDARVCRDPGFSCRSTRPQGARLSRSPSTAHGSRRCRFYEPSHRTRLRNQQEIFLRRAHSHGIKDHACLHLADCGDY